MCFGQRLPRLGLTAFVWLACPQLAHAEPWAGAGPTATSTPADSAPPTTPLNVRTARVTGGAHAAASRAALHDVPMSLFGGGAELILAFPARSQLELRAETSFEYSSGWTQAGLDVRSRQLRMGMDIGWSWFHFKPFADAGVLSIDRVSAPSSFDAAFLGVGLRLGPELKLASHHVLGLDFLATCNTATQTSYGAGLRYFY